MRRWFIGLAFVVLSTAAIAWHFQASRLYVNGELASSGVIERNGVAYAPIKDIASALKLNIQKTSRGYELAATGGANQAEGITGKVGDMLFNGYARFQVVKVIRGKEYTNQFSGDNQKVTPYPEGMDLVVVVCRIKNGLTHKVSCGLPAGTETALADTQDHSFGPRTGLSIDCPNRGVDLLPGAAVDFALTFDVPASTVLGDLVYQVEFYSDAGAAKKKFRVSLKQ
jgi:hypothetical protein